MIRFIFTKFNIVFIRPDLVWFTETMLNVIMVECGQTGKPIRIFWINVTMRRTQSFKSEEWIQKEILPLWLKVDESSQMPFTSFLLIFFLRRKIV